MVFSLHIDKININISININYVTFIGSELGLLIFGGSMSSEGFEVPGISHRRQEITELRSHFITDSVLILSLSNILNKDVQTSALE